MGQATQATIRFVVVIVATTILLVTNASNFDSTEIKSLLGIAVAIVGSEGLTWARREPN